MRRLRTTILIAVVAVLTLGSAAIATAADGGRPFRLTLTGAAEVSPAGVPNQGDPDGTGTAVLTLNPGQGEVCYDVTVSGVADLTAAHIHRAPATSPGPVVIPTPLGATGGSGCVSADRGLILDILLNPENYYFNVHNAEYPAGALRAQLG
jgi:hypothetical protein